MLALISVWLWNQNRTVIIEQRKSLARLCDTTTALDLAVVVPLLNEARLVLGYLPPGPERARAKRLEANLQVAHAELSTATLCDPVG